MIRLFQQHRIRKQRELEEMWRFEAQGRSFSLPVPGCWEQHPDLCAYRGTGVYKKEINVEQETNLFLTLKGVSHTADVFFDGVKTARHYNAYTPFCIWLKNVKPGKHQLNIQVDNRFGEESSLHIPNDYYSYGGLTRPVVLEEVPDIFIRRIHFTPSQEKENEWRGEFEAVLWSGYETDKEAELTLRLAGKNFTKKTVCRPGENRIHFSEKFVDLVPWTCETPQLYSLTAILSYDGKPQDDLIERVGFREMKIQEGKLYLNGRPLFLKGVNRHEDYAIVGCAIPFQLFTYDLELIRNLGANAVRTSHYPNDERFLDLCDEMGILVWEENHARGLTLEQMKHKNFDRQCEDCIQEMVSEHFNHPSILLWGILNECASHTPEGREKYQKQFNQIRQMDKSRPRTTATCQHFKDLCLDLPDIVSVNIYTGWANNLDIAEEWNKEFDWIKTAGGGGKPVIISEFGAEAMYGTRMMSRVKWSEESQADIIGQSLAFYMNREEICGVFIWQFMDCKVVMEEGNWFAVRPRGYNNKGIMDEYRRPKYAYETIKNYFKNGEK